MSDHARLGPAAREAVASPANEVFVSAVTAWEIAIKQALGRLTFPLEQFDTMLQRMGFDPLPIRAAHGILAGGLPRLHDDPFDRLLIAQAVTERLTLVTADDAVRRYDVPVL